MMIIKNQNEILLHVPSLSKIIWRNGWYSNHTDVEEVLNLINSSSYVSDEKLDIVQFYVCDDMFYVVFIKYDRDEKIRALDQS